MQMYLLAQLLYSRPFGYKNAWLTLRALVNGERCGVNVRVVVVVDFGTWRYRSVACQLPTATCRGVAMLLQHVCTHKDLLPKSIKMTR